MGEISIRKAAELDFDFFYSIKCEEDNIYWSGHTSPPQREKLLGFFSSNVSNQDVLHKRTIFIVEDKRDNTFGYLYLDPIEDDKAEISIGVAQAYSGKGFGRMAVVELCELAFGLGFNTICAGVREDNLRSQSMFRHAGFKTTDFYRLQFIQNLNKEIKMLEFVKVRQV